MKTFSPRAQGLIAVNIAAVIFGTAALFGKLDISPIWIVFMRCGFAALTLFAVAIISKNFAFPTRMLWMPLGFTAAIVGVHWLSFFASVQMAGVAIATLTFAAFPFFTILIETVQQKRPPRAVEIACGLAIIFAVALLADIKDVGRGVMLGTVAGLLSAVTFAWFGVASKKLNVVMSPVMISFCQTVLVAIMVAPFLPLAVRMPDTVQEWLWLAVLGMVTTALMHQLYFYALRRLPASVCGGFIALEPVYAILFAAAFFGEAVTLKVSVSAALIIGASLALLRQGK